MPPNPQQNFRIIPFWNRVSAPQPHPNPQQYLRIIPFWNSPPKPTTIFTDYSILEQSVHTQPKYVLFYTHRNSVVSPPQPHPNTQKYTDYSILEQSAQTNNNIYGLFHFGIVRHKNIRIIPFWNSPPKPTTIFTDYSILEYSAHTQQKHVLFYTHRNSV